jgi:uncharacterized OB-fold protein
MAGVALGGRRCAACGRLAVDRGRRCPFCGGEAGTSQPLSGRGRLVSWTTIRVAPARYAAEAPFTVGVIELDEGVRLTARVGGEPDRLVAGQPLVLAGLDDARGPRFDPA